MSKDNIFKVSPLPRGRVLVSFKLRDGGMRHYSYGPVAAKKIKAGSDPSHFKGTEIRV